MNHNSVYWSPDKNDQLKRLRKIAFEDIVGSRFVGIEDHLSRKHQMLMLFEYKKYIWVVPYVQGKGYYFLKTAFPSCKHTKKYLGGGK